MINEAGQFGSFDGLDNRREVMILLARLTDGLPELLARQKRADFLQQLIGFADNCFADKMCVVEPCSLVEAYFFFTSITGVLGVEINAAARLLEEEVHRHEQGTLPVLLQRNHELRLARPTQRSGC